MEAALARLLLEAALLGVLVLAGLALRSIGRRRAVAERRVAQKFAAGRVALLVLFEALLVLHLLGGHRLGIAHAAVLPMAGAGLGRLRPPVGHLLVEDDRRLVVRIVGVGVGVGVDAGQP